MERDGKDSTRVLATKVIKKMWKLVWRAGPVITLLLLLWQSFILRDQIILTREQLKSTQESIHAQTHQEMMKDVLQMNSGIASHPNLARRLSDDIEPTWSDTTIDEAFVIFNILIYIMRTYGTSTSTALSQMMSGKHGRYS